MYSSSSMYLVALGLGAVILAKLFTIGRRPKNLPPGPPTIPILGNIHLMPKRAPHLQFQKWAEEYGPIYSLILGTKTVIVLSSDLAVRELHDKRSAIYSGRPSMYVGQDLASGGLRFGLMDYGSTWRMIRRMMHNILNIVAAKSYVPYQDLENKNMLVGFLDEPNEFYNHIRRYANSLTTQMVFGFRTISINDPKLQQLFRNFHNFSEVAGSGVAVLIDLFPVLRLLPDFLLPMRKYCKKLHASELNLYMGHWLNVKKAIKAGTAKPCFCVDLVKAQDAERLSEDQAAYISGTFLEAGSDTTASELIAFIQALVLYPNVQKVAQEELDRVIGPNRLPTMEDEMNLQYIRGCIKETLRWMPTVILSIPHAVIKDDWYEGYLIPKGATVIHNTWTMHRDPARYVNPEVFDPSRYANDFQSAREAATNPDVSQRDHYAFGTGRRICVGMHIAERSLFLAMSRILWGFNVEPATDENGKEILPDPGNLTQGVVVCPQPFPAKITPRSEKHAALMREQWDECLGLLDKDLQWKEMPKGMKLSTYDATNNEQL